MADVSSSVSTVGKYQVFLSFRGEDTRANFTSHLHAKLCQKKIETYIDDRREKGGGISLELVKAIEESKISVIIFSENYASSSWCLDELVHILKCKGEYGQIVIPVFYNVDPSHVRSQSNSYAVAFDIHEEHSKSKVHQWRVALKEAANIVGWDSSLFR